MKIVLGIASSRGHSESTLREIRHLTMRRRHDVRGEDVDFKRLGAVLAVANDRELIRAMRRITL